MAGGQVVGQTKEDQHEQELDEDIDGNAEALDVRHLGRQRRIFGGIGSHWNLKFEI
jgi:hypothetical protein